MQEKLEAIRREIEAGIGHANSRKELFELKMKYLGKTGEITALLKGMRDIPAEERPAMGKLVNDVRSWAEELLFAAREEELKAKELSEKYASEKIDVTMPARFVGAGSVHPVTLVRRELIDIFAGMGFDVFEGPERNRKGLLQFPGAQHPRRSPRARHAGYLLYHGRILTSLADILGADSRHGEQKAAHQGFESGQGVPLRLGRDPFAHVPPDGGAGRRQGHHPQRFEGIARRVRAPHVQFRRLRPSYFPFTEPSVEVDLSCSNCGGKGCRICKGTGWIEVLGAGMVNRRVLENCGVDPDVYTGFAFGMGLERIAMIKYGINDIRLMFEGDVRFLKQFKD